MNASQGSDRRKPAGRRKPARSSYGPRGRFGDGREDEPRPPSRRSSAGRAGQGRHVSELLQELLRRADLDAEMRVGLAQRAWEKACGSEVARRSRPVKFKGDRLVVAVVNSVWLQELSLRKADLLSAVRRHMPDGLAPSEIQFTLGPDGI